MGVALRAVVVGCGSMGVEASGTRDVVGVATHAEAYQRCRRTRLVGLCDPDAARLARAGQRLGVAEQHAELDALLASCEPQLVSICTPDATHFTLARRAIEHPGVMGVLVEKPLAGSVEEAGALVAAAEARGVVLAVNHSRRYAPALQALSDELAAGSFGRVQAITGYCTKGVLRNGSHWLDLARFLGGDVREVRAQLARESDPADPDLHVQLAFASGAFGQMVSLDARAHAMFEMDVVGTVWRERLSDSAHVRESFRVGDSARYPGYRTLGAREVSEVDFRDLALHAVDDLARAVQEGAAVRCSGRDGRAAVRLATAAIEAARTGRSVEVEP